MIIIYKTTNLINGKIYIGQVTSTRSKSYLGSGTLITNAINKYGKTNFKRETLVEGDFNDEYAGELEKHYIQLYNSRNKSIGYNIQIGGKHRLTGTKKERFIEYCKNRVYSEEYREACRQRMLGTKQSPEIVAKRMKNAKGKKKSEESKEYLRKLFTGKKYENVKELNYKRIPVLQYTLEGDFIKEWECGKWAGEELNISITRITGCCKNRPKHKSAGGFIWKYKNKKIMEEKYKAVISAMTKATKPNVIVEIIQKLFHSRDVIHLAHLKTTIYAQHVALNEYYDAILDFADSLTEKTSGCEGKLLDLTIPASKAEEPLNYLVALKDYILLNREKLEYEWQKNIIDEITAQISETCYKLKFLK